MPRVRGFTLLEIMLVMLVMAVVAAFVVPNLFRPAAATLNDNARHLVRLLHLAAEEAEVRGMALRCSLWPDHYDFELASGAGKWQPLSDHPFGEQRLPSGLRIAGVKLADGVQAAIPSPLHAIAGPADAAQPNDRAGGSVQKGKDAPLGRIIFYSDGMLTLADVTLHAASGDVHIALRPGPAGIRIEQGKP